VGDPAGHLGRSRDGSYREADHGCGVPHQRLSALCPLTFSRGAEEDERGTRALLNGLRSVGYRVALRQRKHVANLAAADMGDIICSFPGDIS